MKVFLSWSDIRSRYVADVLRNWIPRVLQAAKPWMSDEDISTGTRWSAEIASELEQTKVGIICLTNENQHNPWIMFEAGALSKTISQAYVCPYLIGLTPSQLSGPLAQFQSVIANREGTQRILQTLNKALGDLQLPSVELDDIFEVWWPRLEQQLSNIPEASDQTIVRRSTDDILEEVVQNTREQLRREEIRLTTLVEREKKFDEVFQLYETMLNKFTTTTARWPQQLINAQKMMEQLPGIKGQSENIEAKEILAKFVTHSPLASMPELLTGLKQIMDESKEERQKLLNAEDNSKKVDNKPSTETQDK